MTRRGPTGTGWGSRLLRGRRPAAVACAAVAAVLVFAQCSSSGSDPASVASATPFRHQSGSLVQADALGNTIIGGGDRTALSFRFRGAWTGSVEAVRFYVITDKNATGRTGYSAGDGGTMRVALRADSGRAPHVPVGRELAKATIRPMSAADFPLVRLSGHAKIVAGRLYHLVFTNVGPAPDRNYVSINGLYSASRLGHGPSTPHGMAVLERDGGGGWVPRRSRPHEYYLPILEVVGAGSNQRSGLGYMEVWNPKPIGGGAGVRQLLRTAGGAPTRVDGAWLRVRRLGGATTPLVVSLVGADGNPLASATVSPRGVPAGDAGWVHVRFAKPVSVPPATAVSLNASAVRPSSYEAFPIRKGSDYGFDAATYFDEGYAQFNTGDGWVGWDQWGGHDEHDSDLQFALDAVH